MWGVHEGEWMNEIYIWESLYKNKLIFRLILIIIISYSLKCFGVEMYGAPTWYDIEKVYRDQNKNLFLHFILIVVLLYEPITFSFVKSWPWFIYIKMREQMYTTLPWFY